MKGFSRLFVAFKEAKVHYINLDNPHVIILCDKADDPSFFALGAAAQKIPPLFGINLTLASEIADLSKVEGLSKATQLLGSQVSEGLSARTWERGVGPTGACGTGACATAASHLASGFSERDGWLAIAMPGGTVYVRQSEEDGPISLAGPAQQSFLGSMEI